jgi:regulator of cell morphogenesis and NO signaling
MNEQPVSTDVTLAELATRRAAASRVFRRLGLDYCCRGQRSLDAACRARGLDPEALLREIEGAAAAARKDDWSTRPLPDLIRHIVERYHEPLRRELPELLEMAWKVEQVHADKPSAPKGLHDHLTRMHADVLDHLLKEEHVLFPLILAGHGRHAAAPVQAMEHEHKDHGRNLLRMRQLTDDLTPPAEACATWRALYLRLAELEADLMDHIHLENNVLFPRALCE